MNNPFFKSFIISLLTIAIGFTIFTSITIIATDYVDKVISEISMEQMDINSNSVSEIHLMNHVKNCISYIYSFGIILCAAMIVHKIYIFRKNLNNFYN